MKNFIITAGADQKVVLWKWEITSFNQIQVEFISLYHSFVPDIHGLVITSYTRYVFLFLSLFISPVHAEKCLMF